MALRINRFLSQAGWGSRRGVEAIVRAGRVKVNGVVAELSTQIDPERDTVEVDGQPVHADLAPRLWLFHKPLGVVSSFKPQGDAPCLLDVLGNRRPPGRLFHVGRLDRDSTGLLLLSSDGDLGLLLQHPKGEVWKRYEVTLNGDLDADDLAVLRHGELALDDGGCLPIRVEPIGPRRYELALREGRNRQIRRMMEALGLRVHALHRSAVGPLELGDLAAGAWREASSNEWSAIRTAAGAD